MSPVETMYGMLGVAAVDALYWVVMAVCVVGIYLVLRWGFRSS